MTKAKLLYQDKAGNKLFKRFIKTRNSWQFFGTNKEGRLVDGSGVKYLARKAGVKIKAKING